MCGIAGIFNIVKNTPINRNHLQSFIEALKNRGPDDNGMIVGSEFGLAHTRLAVIDPDNGKQPVGYMGWSMTYNGEIYNFKELAKKLESIGIPIMTGCDTEVLIKYIVHFGVQSVKDLDGMFSFAISDGNKIFLARDHVGKKPLFYRIVNGQLYFSSDMGSLLPYGSAEIDWTTLVYSALYGNLTFKDRTVFKEIKTVESGTIMEFDKGDFTPKVARYWQVVPGKKYYNTTFEEQKEILSSLMDEAVKKRLVSDVSLGSYLSGGLDSTIIAHIAKKYKKDLVTYSICYDDDVTRENHYAKMASKAFSTEHVSVVPDFSNFIDDMEYLSFKKQAPLSTPNEVPIYLLAKKAREKLTVVLSGEGADELFAGYSNISRAPIDFKRYFYSKHLSRTEEYVKAYTRLYGTTQFTGQNHHFQTFFKRFSNFDLLQIFHDNKMVMNALSEIDDYFDEIFKSLRYHDEYVQYSAVVFQHNLRSLLERLDFNTMLASLEARAPFLDKKLIDFAFNIPFSSKLKMKSVVNCLCDKNAYDVSSELDITKHILRDTYKSKIPQEIIDRPKQSFPVPYLTLYNSDYRKHLRKRLVENETGVFNARNGKYPIVEWYDEFAVESQVFKLWVLDNIERFLYKTMSF